jgi:putative transposase
MAMEIIEVLSALRSPWQNAYAERVIGSIRRECLNHGHRPEQTTPPAALVVLPPVLSPVPDPPLPRKGFPRAAPVQPTDQGKIIAFPQVGGLHHRYERRAA